MRAIILAAGEGTRLRPHTLTVPKCMVELAGVSLLERQLAVLKACGVDDIIICTGYRAEVVRRLGLPTRHNIRFDRTNMVGTLMCAADLLDGGDDVLITYADIVFEPRVIQALLAAEGDFATTVDRQWLKLWSLRQEDPLEDAETLKLDPSGDIVEVGKKPKSLAEIEAQYMGLILARAPMAPKLASFWRSLEPAGPFDGRDLDNMFMTSFLQALIDTGHPLRAVPVAGGWIEVDTTTDLDRYAAMAADGSLDDFCRLATAGGA